MDAQFIQIGVRLVSVNNDLSWENTHRLKLDWIALVLKTGEISSKTGEKNKQKKQRRKH